MTVDQLTFAKPGAALHVIHPPRSGRRIGEYSLPREFVRMQGLGYPGSLLAKTLIIHQEPSARITVILVPETLGF